MSVRFWFLSFFSLPQFHIFHFTLFSTVAKDTKSLALQRWTYSNWFYSLRIYSSVYYRHGHQSIREMKIEKEINYFLLIEWNDNNWTYWSISKCTQVVSDTKTAKSTREIEKKITTQNSNKFLLEISVQLFSFVKLRTEKKISWREADEIQLKWFLSIKNSSFALQLQMNRGEEQTWILSVTTD